jgi:predicted ester cyclase
VADCISRDNRIHTEWLVRDNGAAVRQLGYDPHVVARGIAQAGAAESYVVSPPTRLDGQAPRRRLDTDETKVEGWARALFHDVWNLRRLDWLTRAYSDDVIAHAGGGRTAQGLRNYQSLVLHVLAAIPDGMMRVEHVCWSEEADGVIVAVRWVLEGHSAPGGVLGECPQGKPVFMMGMSHLRLTGGKIVEEWMLFDEIGVLAQTYR